MKLLLIRFSALGDVAMLAGVVKCLAQQQPQTHLTVLSKQSHADIFLNLAPNVQFIGVDIKNYKTLAQLNKLLQEIDYQQFDAICDMHSVLRTWYLTLYCRLHGKRVVTLKKGRWEKFWLTHGRRQQCRTMTQRYADVFEKLNLHVTLPTASERTATEQQLLGIAPFATYRGKIYPIEKMEKTVEILAKKYSIYLFGGGKQEQEILEKWQEKYPNVRSLAGKQPLRDELNIMRNLRAMISMDSANMHLAALVGTRVISLWGATHPMAGFLAIKQRTTDCIQRELPCRPCSIYGKKTCRYDDYRCWDIEPQTVAQRIEQLLNDQL